MEIQGSGLFLLQWGSLPAVLDLFSSNIFPPATSISCYFFCLFFMEGLTVKHREAPECPCVPGRSEFTEIVRQHFFLHVLGLAGKLQPKIAAGTIVQRTNLDWKVRSARLEKRFFGFLRIEFNS